MGLSPIDLRGIEVTSKRNVTKSQVQKTPAHVPVLQPTDLGVMAIESNRAPSEPLTIGRALLCKKHLKDAALLQISLTALGASAALQTTVTRVHQPDHQAEGGQVELHDRMLAIRGVGLAVMARRDPG